MSIFHDLETLKECEAVLAALTTTDHDEDEYLLHDRTRAQHERGDAPSWGELNKAGMCGQIGRVDHGGPFVAAFLGRDTGDRTKSVRCLTGLPYLVVRSDKATAQHISNTRYTRFKVKDIKDYIVRDLLKHMDYYDVRGKAALEEDAPAKWAAWVQKEFPEFAHRAMRIMTDDETGDLLIALLDPVRATTHGFGKFLEDIQPGEVSISPEAAHILSTVGEQHCGGLPSFMAWPCQEGRGPTVAGMLGPTTRIQRSDISIPPVAWRDLQAVTVIE